MLKSILCVFLLLQKSSEWQQKFWEFLLCLLRLKRSPPPRCPYPMLRRTRHPHRGRNNGVIPMPVDVEPSTRVGWYRRSAWVYTVIAAPPLIPSSFARLKMSVKIFYLFSYHGEKNEKKFFASYDFFCIFASLVKGVSLS